MRVLGHRGSRVPGPENTVASVRAALAAGADGVEIDVRRDGDARLVCIHDPAVAGLAVSRASRRDLDPHGVPTVEDMLEVVDRAGVTVLEVKRDPDRRVDRTRTARALTDLLRSRDDTHRNAHLVVSSFDRLALATVRAAGLRTGLLTPAGLPLRVGVARAVAGGHPELHAHTSALAVLGRRGAATAAVRVHDAGLTLVVWTVTEVEQALRLREAGVDAVICDDPAGVVAALR